MTDQMTSAPPAQLLRGRLNNLRKSRRNQDFVFTGEDRAKMGATAIAAGLAGLGGIATGLSSMAMDTTEEADLLEFELDGKPVKAWVWQSVFQEGDEVEVVAEQWGNSWQGYGIRRAKDKIVALHPHCSRGRYAHYKATFRWWLKIGLSLILFMYFLVAGIVFFGSYPNLVGIVEVCFFGGLALMAILGVIAARVSGKMMGFVRLAEGVFQGFGWTDVKNIDLPAITMKSKQPDDPGALGVLYFRY
jgi:hypothetical protein